MEAKPDLPRTRLGFFPTPLIELERLTARLGGPRIFMKRDDQTGVALGGNKVRKLEFLIGEALALGADTVVTGGAAQSNHCRQTAAAAVMAGLGCHLALGGMRPPVSQGNLLLDRLFGASIHWCGVHRKGETIPDICDELRREGRKPYVVPYGGSNVVGAAGFVHAVEEAVGQLADGPGEPSHIVFASSSGGTQAGLLAGAHLLGKRIEIVGIGIDKDESGTIPFAASVLVLANATAARFGAKKEIEADRVILDKGYVGEGYGIIGALEREAIRLVAATEGILLDPVYTGRAMGGLIDMIRTGRLTAKDTVLFWHTGGTPALFSCDENDLLGR